MEEPEQGPALSNDCIAAVMRFVPASAMGDDDVLHSFAVKYRVYRWNVTLKQLWRSRNVLRILQHLDAGRDCSVVEKRDAWETVHGMLKDGRHRLAYACTRACALKAKDLKHLFRIVAGGPPEHVAGAVWFCERLVEGMGTGGTGGSEAAHAARTLVAAVQKKGGAAAPGMVAYAVRRCIAHGAPIPFDVLHGEVRRGGDDGVANVRLMSGSVSATEDQWTTLVRAAHARDDVPMVRELLRFDSPVSRRPLISYFTGYRGKPSACSDAMNRVVFAALVEVRPERVICLRDLADYAVHKRKHDLVDAFLSDSDAAAAPGEPVFTAHHLLALINEGGQHALAGRVARHIARRAQGAPTHVYNPLDSVYTQAYPLAEVRARRSERLRALIDVCVGSDLRTTMDLPAWLLLAVEAGHVSAARALLQRGDVRLSAETDVGKGQVSPFLAMACASGNGEMAAMLLAAGAPVTPACVAFAVRSGDPALVKMMAQRPP